MLNVLNIAAVSDRILVDARGVATSLEGMAEHAAGVVEDCVHLLGSSLVTLENKGETILHLFLDGEWQRPIEPGESVGIAGPAVVTVSASDDPVSLPEILDPEETAPGKSDDMSESPDGGDDAQELAPIAAQHTGAKS